MCPGDPADQQVDPPAASHPDRHARQEVEHTEQGGESLLVSSFTGGDGHGSDLR